MSTDRFDHPDAPLLRRLREALAWWEEDGASEHPTSAVTGGGAVELLEERLAAQHTHTYAVAVPSATLGLRLALQSLGVGPGAEVLVPGIDWPATSEAVRSLGAVVVPVPVSANDLLIDPRRAAELRTERTAALVACHLHGLVGDVAALREATGVPVVEDAAAAYGAMRHGVLAGTSGDVAVLSLGPGKTLDAGEGGILLTSRSDVHDRAVGLSAHPVRLALSGLSQQPGSLSLRMHPVAAILALHTLSELELDVQRTDWRTAAAAALASEGVVRVLGGAGQQPVSSSIAVQVDPQTSPRVQGTGAVALHPGCRELLDHVRLLPVRTPAVADWIAD